MRIQAVINTQAGTASTLSVKKLRKGLVSVWTGMGHDADVVLADGSEIDHVVRRACNDTQVDAVIIGGGDGTVSRALPHIVASQKALGILPLGTMNYMARDLGISFDPLQAAWSLARGRFMRMDLGSVNGHLFMIWACLGLLPEFIQGRDRARKKKKNSLLDTVLSGVADAVMAYPMIAMELRTPSEHTQVVTSFMMISNNPCQDGNPLLLTRPHLNKGVLGIYVGTDTNPFGLVELGVKAALGQWEGNPMLKTRVASWLDIAAKASQLTLSIDGEIVKMPASLRFESLPSALTMLIPG